MPNVTTKIVNANPIKNGSSIVDINKFGTKQAIAGEIENNAVTNINAVLGDKALTVLSPAAFQFYYRVRNSNSSAAQGYINIGASGQGVSGDVTLSVFPFHPNDAQSIAGLEDIFDVGGYLFIQSKSRPGVYAMFNTDASGASVSGGVMTVTGTYNTGNGIFNDDEIVTVSFDASGSGGGGGGNPFDQDLNTDDNVYFASVSISSGGTNNIILYETGDILVGGVTGSVGTEGQVLTSHGASTPVTWEDAPNPFDQSLNQADSPLFSALYTGSINNSGDSILAIDIGNHILYGSNGTTALLDFSNVGTSGAYYFSGGLLVGDGSALTNLPVPELFSELTDDIGYLIISHFIFGEVPAGTIDSSNPDFSLANVPLGGTYLMVFKNGIYQKLTDDYTVSSNVISFQAGNIPQTGDNIVVTYLY